METDLKRTNSVRSPLSHGIRRASSPKGRAKRRNLLIEINPFYHYMNDNCALILPLPLGEVASCQWQVGAAQARLRPNVSAAEG